MPRNGPLPAVANPKSETEKFIVVSQLASRLNRAMGDWRKYGEGSHEALAMALVVVFGPKVIHRVLSHLNPDNGAFNDQSEPNPTDQ